MFDAVRKSVLHVFRQVRKRVLRRPMQMTNVERPFETTHPGDTRSCCFHIQWSMSKLDWECHRTFSEAQLRALELAMPGEVFAIQKCENGKGTPACPGVQILLSKIRSIQRH
jgi:hypothetical protein